MRFVLLFCSLVSICQFATACGICNKMWNPVCAELNGKLRTFSNSCRWEAAVTCGNEGDWIIKYYGECEVAETTQEPTLPISSARKNTPMVGYILVIINFIAYTYHCN